jgi:hypothetical protein
VTDCFTDLDWDRPAKTLDFGSEGYTASVSDFWHDMLQMTVPDETCGGIVYVRGDFPDNPGAILARAQTDLRYRSWGLQLRNEKYKLDYASEQSLINHRWPYTQYDLKRKKYNDGTYTICSFVKDATVYQVLRLVHGEPVPQEQRDQPTVNRRNSMASIHMTKKTVQMEFKLGGNVRFGCVDRTEQQKEDKYTLSTSEDGLQYSCISSSFRKKLTIQLFSNGKNVKVKSHDLELPSSGFPGHQNATASDMHTQRSIDLSFSHFEDVEPSKPTVIVAAFSLRSMEDNTPLSFISSTEMEDYLGVGENSNHRTKRLWDACKTSTDEAVKFDEITAIARSFEIISNVTSISTKTLLMSPRESMYQHSHEESTNEITKSPQSTAKKEDFDLAPGNGKTTIDPNI